jgi:plastocyanin
MRFHHVSAALGLTAFALLGLAPEPARADGRRSFCGPVYYPAAPVVHRQFAPPMYASPRVYYAPPMFYQQPHANRPSYEPIPSPARPTTTMTVGVNDNSFEPKTINVQPGTTVRWVNQGKHTHTMTSRDGRWDSGDVPPGASYSATFQNPGTYHYYCRHHQGMEGTIVVGPGGGSGPGGTGRSGY